MAIKSPFQLQWVIPIFLTFSELRATNFRSEVHTYEKISILLEFVQVYTSIVAHIEYCGVCHGRIDR